MVFSMWVGIGTVGFRMQLFNNSYRMFGLLTLLE